MERNDENIKGRNEELVGLILTAGSSDGRIPD